jgi:hypothetical protein
MIEVFLLEQAVAHEQCGADEQGVSCEGRWGLVGGVSVTDRSGGKNLPPALAGTMEKTEEFISTRADVA